MAIRGEQIRRTSCFSREYVHRAGCCFMQIPVVTLGAILFFLSLHALAFKTPDRLGALVSIALLLKSPLAGVDQERLLPSVGCL